METEIPFFLGRFHPLVVHLPIGIIVIGVVLEGIIALRSKQAIGLRYAVRYIWLSAGISGLVAVTTGWLLSGEGGLVRSSVEWHGWMGVVVTGLAFMAWIFTFHGKWKVSKSVYYANIGLLAIALSITGHLGGQMTHGRDYLIEYAPRIIKQWWGYEGVGMDMPVSDNPDSVLVYGHLVQPILADKCISCHNDDQSKGGLDLTTEEALLRGGDELPAVVGGQPMESGIFQRVTLPFGHSKFMPPRGRPLSYREVRILEWWIENGASFSNPVSAEKLPDDLIRILLEEYNLDTRPRPFYEVLSMEPVAPAILNSILDEGFSGGVLAEGNNFLRLKARRKQLSESDWQLLEQVKDHVVMLDLAGTNANDGSLLVVSQMKNLYKLDLNNTIITDEGLEILTRLERLEILNLYGTSVSDRGVADLKAISSLKKIYLWESGVSDDFIHSWRNENSMIDIVW